MSERERNCKITKPSLGRFKLNPCLDAQARFGATGICGNLPHEVCYVLCSCHLYIAVWDISVSRCGRKASANCTELVYRKP